MGKAKNVIVTGAAHGIGRAVARHLGQLGHRLFLIDINETELSHTAEKHIPLTISSGRPAGSSEVDVGYRSCNLRDTAAVRETIRAAAEMFGGGIDVLVNNAGIPRPQWTGNRTMEDPSVLDEWVAYIETNLTSAFVASQAVLPFMKAKRGGGNDERRGEDVLNQDDCEGKETRKANSIADAGPTAAGGCIINVSSIHAMQTDPNCEGYAASKAGLLGLTHGIAMSGAQWGIRCNAILPGLIERSHENQRADETGKTWASDFEEARHARHPAGRVGAGEDVARTVEWLMDAGFVTGQSIVVDGGVTKIKFAV